MRVHPSSASQSVSEVSAGHSHHLAGLSPPLTLLRRVGRFTAGGLGMLLARKGVKSVELVVGFMGSRSTSLSLKLDKQGLTSQFDGPALDELADDPQWLPVADPFAPGEGLPVGMIRCEGGKVQAQDVVHLGVMIHAARVDHLGAVVADHPEERANLDSRRELRRSSKAWLYDFLANVPALLGVDLAAGLLLPDHLQMGQPGQGEQKTYVLAAERLFVAEDDPIESEHLIGLLVPCENGHGGLLEAALEMHSRDPDTPYHLFIPEDPEGERWQWLGYGHEESFKRFNTGVQRIQEGMTALIPVELPGALPGFLSLCWRTPAPLPEASVQMLETMRERFGDALLHSDLFQVPVERAALLEAFASAIEDGPCTNRRELIGRLTPYLYESLGAASVGIGVLEEDQDRGERLWFENPMGWDLDQPRQIPLRTADTLSALAMRMGRPIVLAGARQVDATAPALRWNNSLAVNESTGQIEDTRMGLRDYSTQSGWRPLADYYKPTATAPIYAGVVMPIVLGTQTIGVISLDFDRHAPWTAYSGYSAEGFYRTLARLLASHLALLPAA